MSRKLLAADALLLLLGLLMAAPALGQWSSYTRIGLSASPYLYDDTIDIKAGQPVELYILAIGSEDNGFLLDFDVDSFHWAIFEPCCGAGYYVTDVIYNDDLVHVGDPSVGVESKANSCLDQDVIVVATVTMMIEAPRPGVYLIPAGALDPAKDCENRNHLQMDMPVFVNIVGNSTPNDLTTWGAIRSTYR